MGLYYYRHRVYHAHLGRFVSRDPVGYESGHNLFEYVNSAPVQDLDPLGLEGKFQGFPKTCDDVLKAGPINWAKSLTRNLEKRIGRFKGGVERGPDARVGFGRPRCGWFDGSLLVL